MENQTIIKVKNLVETEYKKLPVKFWYHGWEHVKNVAKTTKELSNLEGIESFPCEIAAYCHDLGRIPEALGGDGYETSFSKGRDHARASIEPSTKILNQFNINGDYFNHIIEAVAIHSFWEYQGPNKVAQILRDSDKRDAFGPWGLLRTSTAHLKKYFVDKDNILKNTNNQKRIKELANKTLESIKKDKELSEKYLNTGLRKVLEWVDNKEFHTESAYKLFAEDIKYTKEARDFLSP